MSEIATNEREDLFSKAVRAGKRTYFFNVKSTKANDYYITITESKKRFNEDKPFYEKHKLFLYKEDFEKFIDGLNEAVEFIKANKGSELTSGGSSGYSDVNFGDIGGDAK